MSAEKRVTADIRHGAGHVRLVPFREWRNNPSIKRFRVAADFKWAFSVFKTRRLSGNRSPVRPFVGAGLAASAFPGKTRNRSGRFDAELPLIMAFLAGWPAHGDPATSSPA
jgi:hypothetical protein